MDWATYVGKTSWAGGGGLAKQAQRGEEDSSSKIGQGNTGIKCVSLSSRRIIIRKAN